MLFMPMIAAAALAALSAAGSSLDANSSLIAAITCGWRAASAETMKVPASCCWVSVVSAARLDRLSFRSLAYSGSKDFRDSSDMLALLLGRFIQMKPPSPSPQGLALGSTSSLPTTRFGSRKLVDAKAKPWHDGVGQA